MKIIADNEGVKMGKTTGNMVAFTDSPTDMFGKIMSMDDTFILLGFELFTLVPDDEIAEVATQLATGVNPRDLKLRLAQDVVALLVGEEAAEEALVDWQNTFQKGGTPEGIPTVSATLGDTLIDVVVLAEIAPSRAEFRRLISQGAIKIVREGGESEPILTADAKINASAIYKIGKHRFLHIKIV